MLVQLSCFRAAFLSVTLLLQAMQDGKKAMAKVINAWSVLQHQRSRDAYDILLLERATEARTHMC